MHIDWKKSTHTNTNSTKSLDDVPSQANQDEDHSVENTYIRIHKVIWVPSDSWTIQYLSPGSNWSPSCLKFKNTSIQNGLFSSCSRTLTLPDPLVSPIAGLGLPVPLVSDSQTLCFLQCVSQTYDHSSPWVPSPLFYLLTSPAWCLLAIAHTDIHILTICTHCSLHSC